MSDKSISPSPQPQLMQPNDPLVQKLKEYNHSNYLKNKAKVIVRVKDWKDKHPDYMRGYMRGYVKKVRTSIKKEIFSLLGGKCVGCGYQGLALQIDHINNDGWIERKKVNIGSYYLIILNKIKKGSKEYQLLCANCNMEKELLRRMKVI